MGPRKQPAKPTSTGKDMKARGNNRKKQGPVRWLENGLLNVNRKSGKNVPIIKRNSQTPLLSLPAEIRNQIWEYALGGNIFNVKRVDKPRRRYGMHHSKVILPDESFSLLRTCRQIYAESCTMPLRVNILQFRAGDTIDWMSKLPAVQKNAIAAIRIESWNAESFFEVPETIWPSKWLLPETLSKLSVFRGLKRVVIRVQRDPDKADEIRLSKAQKEIETYMSAKFNHVKVTFEHTPRL